MLFPAAAAGTAFLPRLQGIPARRESPLMGRGLPTSRTSWEGGGGYGGRRATFLQKGSLLPPILFLSPPHNAPRLYGFHSGGGHPGDLQGAQKRGGDGGLPGIGIGPGDEKPLHDRSSRSPSTSYISASSQKAQPLVVR